VPPSAKSATAPRFENDCTQFYPPAAAESGVEGTTVVSLHITADGAVRNAQIAETSGNSDLDKAAVACLNGARMKPLKKGGAPIEADTEVRVTWQRSFFGDAPIARTQNTCRAFYPPLAVRLEHEGTTVLSFTIAEDGTVKNIAVAESSGYDELDKATIECVSKFQYRPVKQNGRPVAIDSTTRFVWRLR
jgi:TonB family protein